MAEVLKPIIDQRAVMATGTLVPVEYVRKVGDLGKEIHLELLCRVKSPLVFTPDGQVNSVLSRLERPDKECPHPDERNPSLELPSRIEIPHTVLVEGGVAGNFRLDGIKEELDLRAGVSAPVPRPRWMFPR